MWTRTERPCQTVSVNIHWLRIALVSCVINLKTDVRTELYSQAVQLLISSSHLDCQLLMSGSLLSAAGAPHAYVAFESARVRVELGLSDHH